MNRFPPGFLFGSSTSAHQVEGGNRNDWTEWEKVTATEMALKTNRSTNYGQGPTPVWKVIEPQAKDPGNYISGEASGHYTRYPNDLATAQGLNLNAFRFSIEWSRVEPEKGYYDVAAIQHYVDVAKACRKFGQEPMVTLWHFSLPVWAADLGGWESEEVVARFTDYAEVMGRALQPEVHLWATLNEPEVYSAEAYLLATWPPQRRSLWRYIRVRRALLRAHVGAYKALKTVDKSFEVGLCTSQTLFDARHFFMRPVAWVGGRIINDYFVDRLAYECDWLGAQYYVHRVIDRRVRGPKSDLGWELYPQGHGRVLKGLARFGRPIYVTESGIADARDERRAHYIEVSMASIAEAIAEGVDVRGYFYWSLLDNFEWHEGFWPKFGLLDVDRETLIRTVRPSALHYASLVRAAQKR